MAERNRDMVEFNPNLDESKLQMANASQIWPSTTQVGRTRTSLTMQQSTPHITFVPPT